MSTEHTPGRHEVPAQRHDVSERDGYAPARTSTHTHTQPHLQRPDAHTDDHNHPLHRVYRKRIRGIRARWFGSGFGLGVVAGIILTLIASAVVITQIPSVVQTFTGEPDVAVVIGENFLNRAASRRLEQPYQLGVPNLTLRSLAIDLKPDNRMDLQPTFNVNVTLAKFDVNATVKNELTVQDGKLVISMIGDPQLGSLNVPFVLLPFNLNDRVKRAIDKVNTDLLISEINKSVSTGFGSSEFSVEGVTTSENSMTVSLVQK